MRPLPILLAPLTLLLIGAAAAGAPDGPGRAGTKPWSIAAWRQVRIEQHFLIRITPGTAAMPPAEIEEIQQEERIDRVDERKIGKCLAISAIASEQPGDGNKLLLFLHDQSVISATLEKRCNAREFYSGFYLLHNGDGAICAGRDTLQSRNGANCKVRRLSELVPTHYRRFP